MSHSGHINVDDLKSAARGRWREVLTSVGGFNGNDLDGRHHPCPRCEGTDRFRLIDEEAGAVLCNQCFAEANGDGLAAIQWRNGWTFGETIKAVAAHLGIQTTNGSPNLFSEQFRIPFGTSTEAGSKRQADAFEMFAKSKPPLTTEAIQAAGAKVVVWPNHPDGKLCIAFPAFNRMDELTGYILRRVDGEDFPAIGNLQVRKTHMLRGSHDGWVIPGGFDRVTQADVIWRVEGVPDALALFPCLPPNHAVITNICGAKSSPQNLGILAGKTVNVVGDADVTGQEGAVKFATKALTVAGRVKLIPLPYDISEVHGRDVRDYLIDSHTFAELLTVAAAAEDFVKPKRGSSSKRDQEQPTNELPDAGDDWTSLREDKGRTERANSRRFLKQHGDRVRFCHSWGKWLCWTGTHWQIDDGGAVMRLAMATADSVWHDAKECMTKPVVDFAVATSGHGKLSAMLKLAAADVPVSVDDLDANPWLLNCPNGTLDLRTGELKPHRREDNITKLCPTNFSPEAGSYHFDKFLEGVFDGHQPTIDFIQRFTGYAVTGDVSEQILAVCYGAGSNGKSTLLNAIQDTLGLDYAMAAPTALLTVKNSESHPTELADLFGKRFVVSQETEDGNRLAESLVKQMTGGDRIRARRMREDFWQFAPSHKLVLCTNHKPRVKGTDHAIWRRLVLIPFAQKYWNPDKGETGPDELRQDKTLPLKLTTEAEGILAWMVRGCLDWQCNGLQIPDSVRAATEEYRAENDTLGRFVETCCIRSNAVSVKFASLFDALAKWCGESGDFVPTKRIVGAWLKENGFQEFANNGRWYRGITTNLEHTPDRQRNERNERNEVSV